MYLASLSPECAHDYNLAVMDALQLRRLACPCLSHGHAALVPTKLGAVPTGRKAALQALAAFSLGLADLLMLKHVCMA